MKGIELKIQKTIIEVDVKWGWVIVTESLTIDLLENYCIHFKYNFRHYSSFMFSSMSFIGLLWFYWAAAGFKVKACSTTFWDKNLDFIELNFIFGIVNLNKTIEAKTIWNKTWFRYENEIESCWVGKQALIRLRSKYFERVFLNNKKIFFE